MAEIIQVVYFSEQKLPFVVTIDSLVLYSMVKTLHECADYRFRFIVSGIRDSFETEEIDVIQWIQGNKNISDAFSPFHEIDNPRYTPHIHYYFG